MDGDICVMVTVFHIVLCQSAGCVRSCVRVWSMVDCARVDSRVSCVRVGSRVSCMGVGCVRVRSRVR